MPSFCLPSSRLLVGAPRAQTSQPGTNRSGAVYKCPMTTWLQDCKQIPIEEEKTDSPTWLRVTDAFFFFFSFSCLAAPENTILKDDQWLGVTVRSQGPGGYVLACAHRHVSMGPSYRWGRGICYSLTQYLDLERAWEPCENRPVDKAHEQFGFCQAGTSGVISEDSTIVLGSPGPYTWKGTIFTISAKRLLKDWVWNVSPFLEEDAPVEKYSYLGMSVTSGRFFHNQTTFVAGAPRSNGTGKVVFFDKDKASTKLHTALILDGEQFASSFGYSLTSLDLNSDGFIDLVVGAPFYHGKGEGGAVYIYMNSKTGISKATKPIKLVGKDESRFGFGLSSTGDLNKDGFPDLAVGAPYEDGGGAIYIYLGSADGIVKEPSQVIRPSDLPKPLSSKLTTLGYSLFGGMDLDSNGYPDLLSGNYESDSVILFRSRPIIDISTSVKGKLTNIDPTVPGCPEDLRSPYVCFSFEACFQFSRTTQSASLRNGTDNRLQLEYRIEAETFTGKKYYRVRFNASADSDTPNVVTRELELQWWTLGREHCSRELVYLKDKSDIQSPIKMKLMYKLVQKEPRYPVEGAGLPDIDRLPILNQKEASKVFEARFLKNCGSNDICESDLHVEADLILPKEAGGVPVLYLGEEHINMSIKVHNRGEPAYDAALYVFHPSVLSYVGRKLISSGTDVVDCVPLESYVKCELGNPLNQGTLEIFLRFNARSEADAETSLNFIISANTTSLELSPQRDLDIDVNVVRVAELELRGATKPEQVWYGGVVVGAHAMKHFDEHSKPFLRCHCQQVFNHGPWTVPTLDVVVSWPYEAENEQKHGKYLLYMTEEPKVVGDGECRMLEGQVNPLGLKVSSSSCKKLFECTNLNCSLISFPPFQHRPAPASLSRSRSREKREVVITPEEVRLEGKTVRLVTMKCDRGSAKCFKFRCTIRNLKKQLSATITINARLWNATLVEDYAAVDQVSIFSSAEIELDPSLEVRQRPEDDFAHAETRAYPDASLYQKSEGVALWIIILAVCAGILLLLLVIFLLYKLGFFKRKRPAEGYSPAPTSDKDFNGSS
ncbi:integrin alpha-ps, putative [Ixodes scapularis]|uniref:Integrin alpha-ps, putative n=1 Tax=Ixodes scapularis TaxID=6945 RepID=B7PQK7_IXOSC|nr:integrin alpha-ps, putative [Ixodes scapularis]|eukprot:XP_002436049.1 integrin alpha-ps, putative [Ixodes scapularis]